MSNNTAHVTFRDDGFLVIKGVRLSYPHLFKKWAKDGDDKDKAKFSAKFLLPKDTHAADIKAINQHIVAMMQEAFKGRIPNDKLCHRNGADLGRDDFEPYWVLSASESVRPTVVNKDRSPIAEEDDIVYAGCYVNVTVRFWAQNNKFGKRINANLVAVQFVKDGERFSDRPQVDVDELFEDESGGVAGAASDDEGDGLD
jgi:hypothetical protein